MNLDRTSLAQMATRTWVAAIAALVIVAAACSADVTPDPESAEPSDDATPSSTDDATPSNTDVDDPVIIVAGTFSPEFANQPLEARLSADGYDAHIFVLPEQGRPDMAETSESLAEFVDDVLATTGAEKVDLIGHSQGGLLARYYVKELGGVDTVDTVITLGTPNYGTELADGTLSSGTSDDCIACAQMAVGSEFLNALNEGDDTIGSVEYTTIYTTFDPVVRPVENAALEDGATNVLVQDQCRFRLVEHIGLIFDGAVYSGIRDALEHQAVELDCWAL